LLLLLLLLLTAADIKEVSFDLAGQTTSTGPLSCREVKPLLEMQSAPRLTAANNNFGNGPACLGTAAILTTWNNFSYDPKPRC